MTTAASVKPNRRIALAATAASYAALFGAVALREANAILLLSLGGVALFIGAYTSRTDLLVPAALLLGASSLVGEAAGSQTQELLRLSGVALLLTVTLGLASSASLLRRSAADVRPTVLITRISSHLVVGIVGVCIVVAVTSLVSNQGFGTLMIPIGLACLAAALLASRRGLGRGATDLGWSPPPPTGPPVGAIVSQSPTTRSSDQLGPPPPRPRRSPPAPPKMDARLPPAPPGNSRT